ncbi:MAG: EscU/YscU/HrcU family type III secretion system export apparatus switch protein [Actinomycetales bacterium]|nr:EscU/YscU/HrcU family type III secretion system export apparatus switch protein [Actinomycetales bacterium]
MAEQEGRTEKPTPKRLRDARREGQFPRTQDAAMWAGLAAGTALVPQSAHLLRDRFAQLLDMLPEVAADPSLVRVLRAVSELPAAVLVPVAPVCLGAAAGSLLATAVQGVHPSPVVLKPKFSRLNPKQGLKRMFGVRAAWEGLKAVLKVAIIAAVVVALGRDLAPELIASGMHLPTIIESAWSALRTTLWAAIAAGAVLALADYAYQRHTVMKQLKMSPRDIRDELKQTEGDPMLKGAIRSRQLAMSRNRMLSEVATADVVLVNPTHLAVALRYEQGKGAPRVIAKGAGAVAARIRERAREHRVPVVEDKPLTRALYRICELGEEVPTELYLAVARILAFVMSTGRPSRKAGTQRPSSPRIPLPRLPDRAELRSRRTRGARAARESRQARGRR